MMPYLILQAEDGRWLEFQRPLRQFVVHRLADVVPILREIEAAVNEQGHWAAGFLSYGAAPAFDPVLVVRPSATDLPLLWFGLFAEMNLRTTVRLPEADTAYKLGEWRPSVSEAAYRAAIAVIKEQIAQGETYQVNYTFRQQALFQGDPFAFFRELYRAQQSAHAAYLDVGDWAICSASPELFFRLEGDVLTTRPMKGTVARGLTLSDDEKQADWLRHSAKNRAENVMIVDMIRNDLGRVAKIGSVAVPHLFQVERYPTLWQMTSTVTAVTNAPWVEILAALFPCASITGAPKVRTMEIIAGLETTPRGVYCGSIGYLAPGRRSHFNVAIRTVAIDRRQGIAEYGVGGGVVWDSSAGGEYAECQLKARLLTRSLPVFDLLESLLWQPDEGYFLLDYHLRRLVETAAYFNVPLDRAAVKEQLAAAVAHESQPRKVRLLVSQTGLITVELSQLPAPLQTVSLAAQPISRDNPFLYHKTTHRQVYKQSRGGHPDSDEILLWNEAGELTEATIANVVVQYHGHWLTPPVASGLLPGVMRQHLLDQSHIREAIIPVEWLPDCKEIVLINSVRGWQPVTFIE